MPPVRSSEKLYDPREFFFWKRVESITQDAKTLVLTRAHRCIVIVMRNTKGALDWSEQTWFRERSDASDGSHGAPALELEYLSSHDHLARLGGSLA
jgi:hypothetical protein